MWGVAHCVENWTATRPGLHKLGRHAFPILSRVFFGIFTKFDSMEHIFYEGQVIWAQIDANRHLRHSAYADVCAQARANMLAQAGLPLAKIAESGIGPVLFREELIYLREIMADQHIRVAVEMTRYNPHNSRFSFRHTIFREDGTKCAVVNVDGAWIDIKKRKLTRLPEAWDNVIDALPKSDDFEHSDK